MKNLLVIIPRWKLKIRRFAYVFDSLESRDQLWRGVDERMWTCECKSSYIHMNWPSLCWDYMLPSLGRIQGIRGITWLSTNIFGYSRIEILLFKLFLRYNSWIFRKTFRKVFKAWFSANLMESISSWRRVHVRLAGWPAMSAHRANDIPVTCQNTYSLGKLGIMCGNERIR